MTQWKRNLTVVWISQFLSIVGFSLALPFAPFFIQELGVTDPTAVKFWAAISQASTGIALAIMSPIWGALADRYGRRLMMVRANLAAWLVLLGMAFAPSVGWFVFFRFCQGVFTGTIGAANTFVATSTPRERQGMALGTLSAAVFSGFMIGPLVGGILSEEIGYRSTFALSSFMLLGSALLIMGGVREHLAPVAVSRRAGLSSRRVRPAALGPGLPILILLLFMASARTFDGPLLPLYVQEIHGGLEGASRITGMLNGVAALGAALAGVILGRMADRVHVPVIGTIAAVGAGIGMALFGAFPHFGALFPIRFALAFCAGGLDPVFQIWLSKVTPDAKRGTVFGWAVTAKSVGWAVAPMCSAVLAVAFGIGPTYLVGGFLFCCLVPVIRIVDRMVKAETLRSAGQVERLRG